MPRYTRDQSRDREQDEQVCVWVRACVCVCVCVHFAESNAQGSELPNDSESPKFLGCTISASARLLVFFE